jgi:hypothetical protein
MVVMVDTSRINAELHVSLFPAATIAYCHELILSTGGIRTSKLDAKQTIRLPNSSGNALMSFRSPVEALSVKQL